MLEVQATIAVRANTEIAHPDLREVPLRSARPSPACQARAAGPRQPLRRAAGPTWSLGFSLRMVGAGQRAVVWPAWVWELRWFGSCVFCGSCVGRAFRRWLKPGRSGAARCGWQAPGSQHVGTRVPRAQLLRARTAWQPGWLAWQPGWLAWQPGWLAGWLGAGYCGQPKAASLKGRCSFPGRSLLKNELIAFLVCASAACLRAQSRLLGAVGGKLRLRWTTRC